jgi:hypothetical protein
MDSTTRKRYLGGTCTRQRSLSDEPTFRQLAVASNSDSTPDCTPLAGTLGFVKTKNVGIKEDPWDRRRGLLSR